MKNKFFTVIAVILCVIVSAGFAACGDKPAALSDDELYAQAVRDAMIVEDDEILPLVNIADGEENVTLKDGKVLLAFMHKYPASYPAGEDIELKWGNVWCVSENEMCKWVKDNGDGVTDWTKRLHQVLGMPASKGYTSVTALWVDAEKIYRPANVTDPAAAMKATYQPTGNEIFDGNYKAWFDGNVIWSYFDSAFPWTRLGYTYDWADNDKEYGLSEFIVFSGADAPVSATVEYTLSVEDFIAYVSAA